MELLSASKTPIAITMSLFQLVSFLFVLVIFLTISPAEAVDPVFLRENCTSNETFAANSAFQFNLKTFLTTLSSKATGTTQFYNTTIAGTNPSDTVYGVFMCRGDVPPELCRECVVNATQRLENTSSLVCPFGKGAIIWYDECFVRYSNRNFFSTVDTRPRMRLRNTENVTNPEPYNRLLYLTLNATADEAAKAPIGAKKYATKEANISAFQTLYTLTQCTPDLSPQDCRSCLNDVITDLAWCCLNRIGGRVLYPSCNFRYELYPFYRSEEAASGPTSAGLVPPGTSAYHKEKNGISPGTIIAIVVPITVAVLLFIVGICFLNKRTRTKHDSVREGKDVTDLTTLESLQFDFRTIDEATDHFSTSNKLGEGGFGEVYKGRLSGGQEIAVKRLSKSSGQGAEEFKNEVVLVAKLQHRHLVRLIGFCLQGEEKILIYEFVPNKSLDYVLFDPERQKELDWTRRYKIIHGILRGIEYLHVDSRLRIIHRDLKSSNILLDGDMNPKISDFGMARIFGVDQTQGNTSRIVGTYGYMPPEYAMHGDFSIKSDVYSFGVLLLEIISGKKNSSFYQSDGAEDLLSYAWKLWKDGTPMEMLDPTLRESCNPNEVIRCIHIGLLCVQEDPADRPTTQNILLMLDSFSVTLPAPKEPAFFPHSGTNPSMPFKESQQDQYTTNSVPMSVNEMSFSGIHPR